MRDLNHVTHWVFDLDGTLYPPSTRLFEQIEARMNEWVIRVAGVTPDEAPRLRKYYWRTYGTTLAGLMREHGLDPAGYLAHVHDISLDALEPDPALARTIGALPGRKIVYTNGSRRHAERVCGARGLADAFDALYGFEDADYLPKPERGAFEAVFRRGAVVPRAAAMFEDDPRNLAVPHDMGMVCVHVHAEPLHAAHVDHHATDLSAFLARIAAPAAPPR